MTVIERIRLRQFTSTPYIKAYRERRQAATHWIHFAHIRLTMGGLDPWILNLEGLLPVIRLMGSRHHKCIFQERATVML